MSRVVSRPPIDFARAAPLVALVAWMMFLPDSAAAESVRFLRLTTTCTSCQFGAAIAASGDVNGDGYEDLVVAASPVYRADPPTGLAGVLIYYGGPGADSIPDVRLTDRSMVPTPSFGISIAGVGDVNGDGFADVLVGDGVYPGTAYLFLGGVSMSPLPSASIQSPDPWIAFASSLASAGDLNGDGCADLIVGDPAWNNGRAFVYFGNKEVPASPALILYPPPLINPYQTGFGYDVAPAGDVNGDGHPDLLVTWPKAAFSDYHAPAFIFLGGPGMDAIPDRTLRMWPFGTRPGSPRVSSAGDFNGDGYGDVIVPGPNIVKYPNGVVVIRPTPGRVYVYLGGAGGTPDSIPSFILEGDSTASLFGWSLTGGRDVNGDGYSDIVVGDFRADRDGHQRGRVYVFFGGPNADSKPEVVLDGPSDDDWFGESVAEVDFNGDGVADVIVSAPTQAAGPGVIYAYDLTTPFAARAFLRDGRRTIPLAQAPALLRVQFQPVAGAYENDAVDLSTVRLTYEGGGAMNFIDALDSKVTVESDTDRDGVPELSACFTRDDLTRLLSSVRGRRTTELALEGLLYSRRKFRGSLTLEVVGLPTRESVAASVSPNPLNPQGMLAFTMAEAGRVTVRLYDVRGRLVRELVDGTQLEAGPHSLPIDGRDNRGVALASGVYYYRIDSPGARSLGRFVIAK